jgi:hypothetical protein
VFLRTVREIAARPLAALITTAVSPMEVSLSQPWRDTITDTMKLIGRTRISPNPYGHGNIKKSRETTNFRTSPEAVLVPTESLSVVNVLLKLTFPVTGVMRYQHRYPQNNPLTFGSRTRRFRI